ncbi:MAG: helicase C-terminal domain-containing protein [bacterium]
MISPRTEPASPEPATSVRDATHAYFKKGGLLEQACRATAFDYEHRPQQETMATAVADAIDREKHLVVEAGTGVGKSYAYLLPVLFFALREKKQVIVSTYTISLQEQLIYKDIPFIREKLGLDFKAVMVKGQSNYLCLRRLARAEKSGGDLLKRNEEHELEAIRAWSQRTEEGSLQNLEDQPSPDVWSAVCVEHGNCLWKKCPEYSRCFLMKARKDIRDADLLVVNHHLFFADMALRMQGAAFLPQAQVVVLDEAHQVENVASDHMGLRLSQYAFDHWIRRLYVAETGKGLLGRLKLGDVAHLVTQLSDELDRFFTAVREWAGLGREKSQQIVSAPLDVATSMPHLIANISKHLADLGEEMRDEDLKAELNAARRRGHEMRNGLQAFLEQSLPDQVYWVQREGARRHQTVLYSAPVEVGPALQETLFGSLKTVIMTSATLAVGDRIDYFKERVGAQDAESLSVGSPFDYERQMKIIIPKGMPDPGAAEAYAEASARVIRHYVRRSSGRAFVLFTSDRLMRAVARQVTDYFADQGFTFFMQGDGLARHVMLEKFRTAPGAVLFGLDSFWMGVDVRGEALSNVIITKLPFAVPDEPLVKARMDRIRQKGGDPFRDYSLPEAILKFRQGVGRLIRSSTDEGIVVILDPRIRAKWYGKHFLASIPECPVEEAEI